MLGLLINGKEIKEAGLINHPYKLLIVDIDGTLVCKDGTISAADREALAEVRRSGVQVSLSTGRVAQSCLGIIEELSLDGHHIFFDGALVGDADGGEEVYAQPLNGEVVKLAIEFVRSNDIYLELYTSARYFVERETWSATVHREFFGIEPTVMGFATLCDKERIIKGELFASSPQEEAEAKSFQNQFDGRLRFSWAMTPAYPGAHFVNVLAPGVSKGKAAEALVSHLGISMSEVIAIGDGTNDIPLLSSAGLAVAMGSARDEVKAVTDYVTLDVEHSAAWRRRLRGFWGRSAYFDEK